MDWNNVTGQELWDALREVELRAPRAAWEFLSSFTIPKNKAKWTSRLKCNVYYYISNYLVLLALALSCCLIRNLRGLFGSGLAFVALLSLNDPFATALNEGFIRALRRVHPHTAALVRNALGSFGSQGSLGVGGPRRSKSGAVLFLKRPLFVVILSGAAVYLWYLSSAWLALVGGLTLGVGLVLVHATFRSPNLKARLASAREEFRAVWRGYQADLNHDYTL